MPRVTYVKKCRVDQDQHGCHEHEVRRLAYCVLQITVKDGDIDFLIGEESLWHQVVLDLSPATRPDSPL